MDNKTDLDKTFDLETYFSKLDKTFDLETYFSKLDDIIKNSVYGKKMDFTNMIIKDFIDYIITFDNIDEILENSKTQSEKGFIFERLFDIDRSILEINYMDTSNDEEYARKLQDNDLL